MSDSNSQFDYQAQPYWDEAGTYYPPGFDPQTGTWTDSAFENAYNQGYVWDAASQGWVPLSQQQGASAGQSAGMADDAGEVNAGTDEAKALEQAIRRCMEEDGSLSAGEGSEAASLQVRALLDSAAREKDETTALSQAVPEGLLKDVVQTLGQLVPPREDDDAADVILSPEPDRIPIPVPAGEVPIAPDVRLLVTASELKNGAPGLSPYQWALASQLNFQVAEGEYSDEAMGLDIPYAPCLDADIQREIEGMGAGLKAICLKNGVRLPVDFNGEITPAPVPPVASVLEGMPVSNQSLIRVDHVLKQLPIEYLDRSVFIPINDARMENVLIDGLHVGNDGRILSPGPSSSGLSPDALPTIRRHITEKPFGGGNHDSDPPTEVLRTGPVGPGNTVDSGFKLPSVRLKKSGSRSMAAKDQETIEAVPHSPSSPSSVPTLRPPVFSSVPTIATATPTPTLGAPPPLPVIRRNAMEQAFADAVTPSDMPSGDMEQALSSACRRNNRPSRHATTTSGGNPPPKTSSALTTPPPIPIVGKGGLRSISPIPSNDLFKSAVVRGASLLHKSNGDGKGLLATPTPTVRQADPPPVPTKSKSMAPKPVDPGQPVQPVNLQGVFNVLCRTLDGKAQYNGKLKNPNLTAPILPIEVYPGPKRIELDTSTLQFILFQVPSGTEITPAGRKGRLIFQKGTQRTGYVKDYGANSMGFFFFPVESESNRYGFWFVYSAAVIAVDFI